MDSRIQDLGKRIDEKMQHYVFTEDELEAARTRFIADEKRRKKERERLRREREHMIAIDRWLGVKACDCCRPNEGH